MINYELAKELKDARFPQGYPWICGCNGETTCGLHHETGTPPCVPTLSELIEACGDGEHEFVLRWSPETQWSAIQEGKILDFGSFEVGTELYDCSTPEEVVARLWLELNKER